MPIRWSTELDTGIDIIDQQHKRIVDYINELEEAHTGGHDREAVGHVLDELVDYTLSHFAFEESLQEEAGYPFCKPHKRVHELFTRKVGEYQERFRLGDDVAEDTHKLLQSWLVNHIKRDDADYVSAVKASMNDIVAQKEQKNEKKGWLSRFFG